MNIWGVFDMSKELFKVSQHLPEQSYVINYLCNQKFNSLRIMKPVIVTLHKDNEVQVIFPHNVTFLHLKCAAQLFLATLKAPYDEF